jgi:N-methylhydantoinase B
MTTDIFSEGLQVPILKYQSAGEINQDLVDILYMNVRLADRAMGDLRAQITAVKTGERLFLDLLDRYGREPVLGAIAAIMDQSEAAARARALAIPDGVYEAESFMDDDGVEIATQIPIRVRVIVAGDRMTIDLSDVSKQVRGFYNSGITTGHACAQVAFKCLTSPTDYPINDGSFRNLETIVPPGRIVSAQRPAAMRWWMTFPMTIVDTVFKALAPAIPDQVIAGHHADLIIAMMNGINPANSEFFIGFIGPSGGGWGAKKNEDGVSATICMNDGDTHNGPVEQLEAKFPILVERHALRPDSGGAGRRRGGLGLEYVIEARAPITINTQIDRVHCSPWGLEGGADAVGNSVAVRRDGQWKDDFPNAKVLTARLRAGDAFALRSGGGGGFGPAEERALDAVARDVRQGYVTPAAAEARYGVVCDAETGGVDVGASERARGQREAGSNGSEVEA